MELNEEQIDFIRRDIHSKGIELEQLRESIVDHICCIIEETMQDEEDFFSFYEKTIAAFYHTNLKKIETDTLALTIHKKYYAMKKSILLSGGFSAILFIIGSLFKTMHWPGTAVLLVSALFI